MLTETETENNDSSEAKAPPAYKNKTKILILSSRGVGYRIRHLMSDLVDLLPHAKKDVKLDEKGRLEAVNEVCDLKGCNCSIFIEARKKKDFYMWFARTPDGPSVKFHLLNVHTTAELRMTGNALKGSRPLVYFDPMFDSAPQYQIMKEIFSTMFNVPRGHHKSKPFIDHVIGFYIVDGRIWFRNFQISAMRESKTPEPVLAEIGPRFVLNPIRVFSQSFRGQTLWDNPMFISPNLVSSLFLCPLHW
jgi:ribosome biogenesis protein BRX1